MDILVGVAHGRRHGIGQIMLNIVVSCEYFIFLSVCLSFRYCETIGIKVKLDLGKVQEKNMSSTPLTLVKGRCAHKFGLRCRIKDQIVQ